MRLYASFFVGWWFDLKRSGALFRDSSLAYCENSSSEAFKVSFYSPLFILQFDFG